MQSKGIELSGKKFFKHFKNKLILVELLEGKIEKCRDGLCGHPG